MIYKCTIFPMHFSPCGFFVKLTCIIDSRPIHPEIIRLVILVIGSDPDVISEFWALLTKQNNRTLLSLYISHNLIPSLTSQSHIIISSLNITINHIMTLSHNPGRSSLNIIVTHYYDFAKHNSHTLIYMSSLIIKSHIIISSLTITITHYYRLTKHNNHIRHFRRILGALH